MQDEAALEAELAAMRSTWARLAPATEPSENSATPCLSSDGAVEVRTRIALSSHSHRDLRSSPSGRAGYVYLFRAADSFTARQLALTC